MDVIFIRGDELDTGTSGPSQAVRSARVDPPGATGSQRVGKAAVAS